MDWRMGKMETRFAEIIWANEPISSGELVKLCRQQLEWKKSTTYTMLRRLCQRGIARNQDGVVSTLLTRQEVEGMQSEEFLRETFQGSLPRFLAAFTSRARLSWGLSRARLSPQEVRELEEIIRRGGEGGDGHD